MCPEMLQLHYSHSCGVFFFCMNKYLLFEFSFFHLDVCWSNFKIIKHREQVRFLAVFCFMKFPYIWDLGEMPVI